MPPAIEVTQIDPALVKRGASLFKLLHKAELTLATAESCTGGLIAAVLSDAPGAGDRFHGGFVLYTKEQKIAFGIPGNLIDVNGIVSEEVARAMAEITLKHSPADIAVGVTVSPAPSRMTKETRWALPASPRRAASTIRSRTLIT